MDNVTMDTNTVPLLWSTQRCRNNPEAYRNIVKRMLEAHGRGIWTASAEMQKKLQEQYGDIDDELEHAQ
jgi:magnesium chelatase subunit H